MKNLTLGKKMIWVISTLALLTVFLILKNQYQQFVWQKNITTAEHRLQLGSYIFTKSYESTGSQSSKMSYYVFKVTHLDGDFVKLAVVRRLSLKDIIKEDDFSINEEQYEAFKTTIINTTVTGILAADLYKGDRNFELNEYLIKKYPILQKSRWYYEDIDSALKKPVPVEADGLRSEEFRNYISLVYSKEKIIKDAQLWPYLLEDYYRSEPPKLYPSSGYAKDIELIINKR